MNKLSLCRKKVPAHFYPSLGILCLVWTFIFMGACNVDDGFIKAEDAGQDVSSDCGAGETLCDGKCVDLRSNPKACGSCTIECAAPDHGSSACVDSQCEITCDQGFERCGDRCIDTNSDPDHCGQCDQACSTSNNEIALCIDGSCEISCPDGLAQCGDQCVDLNTDPNFCGNCETQCPLPQNSTALCVQGNCNFSCEGTNLRRCGNACADTKTDPSHCGSCNNICGSNEACEDGSCVEVECPANHTLCANTDTEPPTPICVHLMSDDSHCGACNQACGEGERCCTGKCIDDSKHCLIQIGR